jgi:Ankyrin repeats (3 copies)
VEILLEEAPLLVETRNVKGATPLHVAAFSGSVPIVEKLLRADESRQSPLAVDASGNTPFHHAAWSKNVAVAKLMVDHARKFCPGGAAVLSTSNASGETPLDIARSNEAEEMTRYLSRQVLADLDSEQVSDSTSGSEEPLPPIPSAVSMIQLGDALNASAVTGIDSDAEVTESDYDSSGYESLEGISPEELDPSSGGELLVHVPETVSLALRDSSSIEPIGSSEALSEALLAEKAGREPRDMPSDAQQTDTPDRLPLGSIIQAQRIAKKWLANRACYSLLLGESSRLRLMNQWRDASRPDHVISRGESARNDVVRRIVATEIDAYSDIAVLLTRIRAPILARDVIREREATVLFDALKGVAAAQRVALEAWRRTAPGDAARAYAATVHTLCNRLVKFVTGIEKRVLLAAHISHQRSFRQWKHQSSIRGIPRWNLTDSFLRLAEHLDTQAHLFKKLVLKTPLDHRDYVPAVQCDNELRAARQSINEVFDEDVVPLQALLALERSMVGKSTNEPPPKLVRPGRCV